MKNSKYIIITLICMLITGLVTYNFSKTNNTENNNYEGYRELIEKVDYGDEITYVIGHKSPDSDTVSAAIAYANLLNELGIKAKAVVSARVNNETKYYLEYFNIEIPEILNDATGKQFVLVDHSAYSQAIDNMDKARIVSVIDHHGIGDVVNTEQIYVRSAAIGSTASLVYLMYKECNVEISEEMAKVMLMGILSDTNNTKKKATTSVDLEAYNELLKIAKINNIDEIYENMEIALASYDGMSDEEIFLNDYKEYLTNGYKYCLAVLEANSTTDAYELADRMYEYIKGNYNELGMDYIFVKIKDNEADNMLMLAYDDKAVEILNDIYGTYDGSKYFIFKKSLSRKEELVPTIDEYLNGIQS